MRRKGVSTKAAGVSLFPFLAVLICTMGALIVLLVMVVQQARVQATVISQSRSQERQDESASAKQLREQEEDYQWKREILEGQRAEQQRTLANHRLKLSHLEDHIRTLEEKWTALRESEAELEQLAGAGGQDVESARDELERLRAVIAIAAKELEEAREQAARRPRSYALIPYRGAHGTRRRPIYIECLADSILLQPEGVVLQAVDFEGPLGPGNPLDAALRATREYWKRYGGAKEGEPYPLLVVRPHGATAYSVARVAMRSWDDEFGYELIGDDIHLAYPQADPALANVLRKAVADARQRQKLLAAAMPNRFPGQEVTGFRVAKHGGGLTPVGGAGRNERWGRGGEDDGDAFGQFRGNQKSQQQKSLAAGKRGHSAGGTAAETVPSPGDGGGQAANPHVAGAGDGDGGSGAAPLCLAAAKGKDWGLPNKAGGLTAITRPISVFCSAQQLVVLPERGDQQRPLVTQLQGTTRDSVEEFVSHIWSRIEWWGIAVTGGYWKPVLRVEVAPGGEQRFAELQVLLAESGLDVERRRR